MKKDNEKSKTPKITNDERAKKQERKKKIIDELNQKYKGYKDYVSSNESLGVYIVRDIVKKINTKGYWIDIVVHTNDTPNEYNGQCSPDLYIVCSLYKRLTKPVYPPKPKTNDKYELEMWQMEVDAITWEVAHKDINTWKRKNNTGEQKSIICYDEKYSFKYDDNKKKIKKTEIIIKAIKTLTDEQFKKISKNNYISNEYLKNLLK